jgi:hypothetical protein
MSWWWSTLAGWIAYCVIAAALVPLSLNAIWASVLVTLALAAIIVTFPKTQQPDSPSRRPQQDLWLRMATASVMVVTLTGVARLLGPTRSGILTAFPAYTTILAVFSHRQGSPSAVRALRGVTVGLYAAAAFLLTLSLSLTHLRGAFSFALASAAGLLVQVATLMYLRHAAS